MGKNEFGIHLCGGSKVAGELLDEIDEIIVDHRQDLPHDVRLGHADVRLRGRDPGLTPESVRTFGNGGLVRTYGRKR